MANKISCECAVCGKGYSYYEGETVDPCERCKGAVFPSYILHGAQGKTIRYEAMQEHLVSEHLASGGTIIGTGGGGGTVPNCRGSYELGTACGRCPKCRDLKMKQIKEAVVGKQQNDKETTYKVVVEAFEFKTKNQAKKFQDAVTDLLPYLRSFKKSCAATSRIEEMDDES